MSPRPPDFEIPPGREPPASPDPRRASVAAFVCPETERLGREVGFPVAVLAVTGDVGRHAARLSATLYGAYSARSYEEWPLIFDEGVLLPRDLAYHHLAFDARWMGAAQMPRGVVIESGCLAVALPRRASLAGLASLVRAGIADLAVDRVARRPGRVRRRAATRRPVVVGPRYALASPGDVERFRVADELYGFRPRDLPRLAKAVAAAAEDLANGAGADRAPGEHVGEVRHG